MAEEYVKRHEWEKSKGNMHRRINEVDAKHDEKHHGLELLITRLSHTNEQMVKGNQNIEGQLVKLNKTMTTQKDEIFHIKHQVKRNTDDISADRAELSAYKKEAADKKKDNIKMFWTALGTLLGGGGITAILGLFF